MKYSVGYQLREDTESSFVSIISRYRDKIAEVYYPWSGIAAGRGDIANNDGYINWHAQNQLISDLKQIRSMGIKTDLLLNGNCMGADSISENLQLKIASILDYLEDADCIPQVVTTASPAIAHMVRQCNEDIDIRASVNMRISTVKGMEYVKHLFNSFCICRDINRDLNRVGQLREWCDNNSKEMYILANSGCMRDCSFQSFHDNMVAHNEDIMQRRNIKGFMPYACWNYLKSKENRVSVLQNTWIRPEDVHNYEQYTPMIKLATRMHKLPAMVIDAYVKEKYHGNLLDLFEPGYGPAFAPDILANDLFPKDWFEKTVQCDKKCEKCNYCKSVLEKIMIKG